MARVSLHRLANASLRILNGFPRRRRGDDGCGHAEFRRVAEDDNNSGTGTGAPRVDFMASAHGVSVWTAPLREQVAGQTRSFQKHKSREQ